MSEQRAGILHARWLVTAVALVSAGSGVAALILRLLSPAAYGEVIAATDLRIAAVVFGALALGGSADRSRPRGAGPPVGWQRGTFLLGALGVVLGMVMLLVSVLG
ncbi:hypothetical protein LQF12_07855 [Ruania suaedae]|uniref:hypothetical protein n=1 Tax=Ruania suaedae TaxID=2897774 RepID=UPI001E56F3A2|nr:hypothetical protein [Ruania suaedae]UFU04474.1 hypothetical protein LQF12_07855 [Ruania suaedae]